MPLIGILFAIRSLSWGSASLLFSSLQCYTLEFKVGTILEQSSAKTWHQKWHHSKIKSTMTWDYECGNKIGSKILVAFCLLFAVPLFTILWNVKAGNRTKLSINLFFPKSLLGSMSHVETVWKKLKNEVVFTASWKRI